MRVCWNLLLWRTFMAQKALLCVLLLLLVVPRGLSMKVVVLEDNEEETEDEGANSGGADQNKITQARLQNHLLKHLKASNLMRMDSKAASELETEVDENAEWNEFDGDVDEFLGQELEPASWKTVIDMPLAEVEISADAGNATGLYYLGLKRILGAQGTPRDIPLGAKTLERSAEAGNSHAQSTLAFLHASGYGVPMSEVKSFLLHAFAAGGHSLQSKMAIAYSYFRQQNYEQAVNMYAIAAAKTVATNHVAGTAPLVEEVRLSSGGEENLDAIRGHRGEDDETIQYVAYTAYNGNVHSLRMLGNLYYWGARGLPLNRARAFDYFKKAAEQGDARSMVNLGEMYARGIGVAPDYEQARHWLLEASEQEDGEAAVAAANGLGYLYARGFGVERNYSKALEYFMSAWRAKDTEAAYYLGVMHLRGLGVKKSPVSALHYFNTAAHSNHLAALYQVAKMQHSGLSLGTPQNFYQAARRYKAVAERGPWGGILRWAHTCYMNGDVGTALLLYSRAAELGYEVAQSNAAWLLDRFGGDSGCIGARGTRCTEEERHARAHRLWRHASEQGNVQAALLIGDAYFYGKGTKRDLERAVEAYRRAKEYKNAQAMFNLGYMHEHGMGLPRDLHLAKRYYDEALEAEPKAELPVKLALAGLWLRLHHPESWMVKALDGLPVFVPRVGQWLVAFIQDEGNVTVVTLLALLGAVLYLRQRQLQPMNAPAAGQPEAVPANGAL